MTTPVVTAVKRYKCPFCPRSWSKRATAQAHIDRCWRNPAARGCKTCVHHQPYGFDSAAFVPGVAMACVEREEECLHPDGPQPFVALRVDCPLWELRGDAS